MDKYIFFFLLISFMFGFNVGSVVYVIYNLIIEICEWVLKNEFYDDLKLNKFLIMINILLII